MTTTAPLNPAAALLLRRIFIAEDSRLPIAHAATEAMTALTDELQQRKLVTTVMGMLAPLPPGPQRHAATRAARALLTDGVENTEARTWLTALGVPIQAPETPRPLDAWMGRITSIPQRRITVADVLRTAPEATMRGGSTPADEVEHWLTAMVTAGQLTVGDDGTYTFPLPSDADLDTALSELRAGRSVPPRTATELVMRGDAVVGDDGTVKVSEGKTETKTTDTLADRILAALAGGKSDTTDLAARLGVHYVEVSRALIELRDAGRVTKFPGTLNWKLVVANTAPPTPKTAPTRTVADASGTSGSKTATTPQAKGTVAPATVTGAKTPTTPQVSPTVSAPETAPVTIGDQILSEVRELRRDMRQALAPITAPKVDAESAEELLAASDPMTTKVLVRVVVLLHVKGELPRTALRKKMNSRWLAFLPEAIRLGLRLGVLDANAKDGTALRLIDPSKVVSNAVLESKAAEQRARDGEESDNGVLGGLAHAARTLSGAVS